MDLLTYLRRCEPEELVRFSGDTYTTKTHDSLKISNGKWCWWSRGIGGTTALDYLIYVQGLSLPDAVERISSTDQSHVERHSEKGRIPPQFRLPPKHADNRRVFSYLKGRGIDPEIIRYCMEQGQLYEDAAHHNCVFVGYQGDIPRYAALRSTLPGSAFMGDVPGSDKRFSFAVPKLAGSNPALCVFEGAIDALSYVSLQDEHRVTQFFKNNLHSGFASLAKRQREIQACRSEKRKRLKQKKIALRMRTVPKVPRGLNEWVRRQMMPAYFFYDYRKGRKTTTGVCSACGQEVELTGVKHNAKDVCPHCGRELTMKANSRIGNLCDRDTCQVIQRTAPDEVVVRIFKVYYDHGRKDEEISEAARKFIRQAPDGTLSCERYYCYFGEWRKGSWPTFMCYQYRFWGDACGYVYCGNLPGALKDTPWQYCPVETFYEHYHERMEMAPFLAAYRRHPKLEHLIKTGFFNLASDLVYRGDVLCTLDETQNRTHRILGVGAEDVPFLRDLDVSLEVLRKFLSYHGLKDRQALLRWQLEHDVTRDIPEILRRTTPHKMMHYLERQQAQTDPQAMGQSRTMQTLVSEYRDYLDLSEKLGDDLTSSFVLFPKNLRKAHDNAAKRLKIKIDAETQRNFRLAYERVMSHLDYQSDGLQIVYPNDPEEIVREGQALHHCVGGYVDRVARKECLILFLRHCDDLATPYYTVEVRERKAVQIRGMKNADPTPEVRRFINSWEKQVLQAA